MAKQTLQERLLKEGYHQVGVVLESNLSAVLQTYKGLKRDKKRAAYRDVIAIRSDVGKGNLFDWVASYDVFAKPWKSE